MGHDHPKYTPKVVEAAMLFEIVELHPRHLRTSELVARIVADLDDQRETETATEAIRSLERADLVRLSDDERVEPTQAALHAYALLA